MKLCAWVASVGGRVKAAALLGVQPTTVYYWLTAQKTPEFKHCIRITAASKGRVSLNQILTETGSYARAKRMDKVRRLKERVSR